MKNKEAHEKALKNTKHTNTEKHSKIIKHIKNTKYQEKKQERHKNTNQ